MDSTLIPHECIDEIAREAGVVAQVAEVTERAMQGELDFAQSFKTRMALLKGTPVSVLDQIADRLELMPGATALMAELRAAGARTVLVSGGFTFFAKNVAGQLGMDEFHANPLEQQEGVLTGEVHSQILDATRKAEILSDVAQSLGIDRSQIMATGDGANDLKMIALADKGVAYHAKPKVQEAAPLAFETWTCRRWFGWFAGVRRSLRFLWQTQSSSLALGAAGSSPASNPPWLGKARPWRAILNHRHNDRVSISRICSHSSISSVCLSARCFSSVTNEGSSLTQSKPHFSISSVGLGRLPNCAQQT